MGKKKILALVMTGVMMLPTVAFAEGNHQNSSHDGKQVISQEKSSESDRDHSEKQGKQDKDGQDKKDAQEHNKGEEKKQENQQNKDAKKQQIQAFKTQMKAKHETMKQLRQQTIAVRQQVEAKTEQLQAIIADIEAGKKTLPQDMLDALLAKADSLKSDTTDVKATTGVRTESTDVQDKVNKQDFNNALASMDKVIAKLQARLDALNKLNADLDSALAIANLATTPAPATTTTSGSTTTTTDTTSGSTTSTGTTSTGTTTNTSTDTTTTTSGN